MEPPQKGREGNIILIRIIWIEVKHGFKTIIFRATPASREISRRNEIFRKSVKEVTVGFKMCQSYPIQCQLSITQVEELGFDKEEAVEVVRREVRCWLIINININININNDQVNAERAEGPRKAATRLWRAPRHGCHATWSWHPFKVNTHVVNADDDGEDLQADLHRRLRSA